MIIFSILGIIAMFGVMFSHHIKQKRSILCDNLEMVFDEMQLHITKNKIPQTRLLSEFIVRHKIFVVNPQLTNIEVLLVLLKNMDKSKFKNNVDRWSELKKNVPKELLDYSDQFSKHIDELVKLSMLRPRFILFTIWNAIRTSVMERVNGCKNAYTSIKTAIENESSIVLNFNQARLA